MVHDVLEQSLGVPWLPHDRRSGRGFGVELEHDDGDPDRIGAALHAAGLTQHPVQLPYGWGRPGHLYGGAAARRRFLRSRGLDPRGYRVDPTAWRYERDSTVTGELVSPVLRDRPADWAALALACATLRRLGATASTRTGGHVHVSTGDLGDDVAAYRRLLHAVDDRRELLYRLAAHPGRGEHRGQRYCGPNPDVAHAHDRLEGLVEAYRQHRTGRPTPFAHRCAVNLAAVRGRADDHVEFRLWDGTLDPALIQAQVRLSQALVECARSPRAAPPVEGPRPEPGPQLRAWRELAAATG